MQDDIRILRVITNFLYIIIRPRMHTHSLNEIVFEIKYYCERNRASNVIHIRASVRYKAKGFNKRVN